MQCDKHGQKRKVKQIFVEDYLSIFTAEDEVTIRQRLAVSNAGLLVDHLEGVIGLGGLRAAREMISDLVISRHGI